MPINGRWVNKSQGIQTVVYYVTVKKIDVQQHGFIFQTLY